MRGFVRGECVVDTVGGPEADAEVKVPSVFHSVYAYRSCVYMYMYTYVDEGFTWMYAMLLCMYACKCVCVLCSYIRYVRAYVCVHCDTYTVLLHTHQRTRAYAHTHQRARACTRTSAHAHTRVHTHAPARTRVHTHRAQAHTRAHTHTCVCVCVHVYEQ